MILSNIGELGRYLPNEYARAVIVLVLVFLVLRLLLGFFNRFFVGLTSKTKTNIDDVLLAKASAPMNFVALMLSFRLALDELELGEALNKQMTLLIYTLLVMALGYLIYVFIDIALLEGWKRLAKRSKVNVNESITNLVHGTLKIILIMLAILYILELWGVEIVPLLGALGIAGLAVALALQPVLANIFSGVSVVLDKSVKVGDWLILSDGTWGIIKKIGIRSTRVETFDKDTIIIPNTQLADSQIRNVSLPAKEVRKSVSFGVAYGSDVDKVKKVVLAELKKLKYVVKEMEPVVRFTEMGDSSLNFKAFFFIDSYENGYASIDEANTRIYNALNKAGIEIPFPQMDVHLKR